MPIYYKILSLTSSFSCVPALLLVALSWKRLSHQLTLLSLLLINSFLADMLSILFVAGGLRTMPIINSFLLIQFVLISVFVYRETTYKTIVLVSSSLAIVLFFVDLIFVADPANVVTHGNVVFSAIGILYVMAFLQRVLTELPFEDITGTPLIWAIFGILCFYCGTFFLLLLNNVLTQYAEIHRVVWILSPLSNILKNVLFTIGLWINLRSLKSS